MRDQIQEIRGGLNVRQQIGRMIDPDRSIRSAFSDPMAAGATAATTAGNGAAGNRRGRRNFRNIPPTRRDPTKLARRSCYPTRLRVLTRPPSSRRVFASPTGALPSSRPASAGNGPNPRDRGARPWRRMRMTPSTTSRCRCSSIWSELRTRLLWSAGGFLIAFFVCYHFSFQIYEFLAQPLVQVLKSRGEEPRLIYTALYEAFFTYIKVSVYAPPLYPSRSSRRRSGCSSRPASIAARSGRCCPSWPPRRSCSWGARRSPTTSSSRWPGASS